MAECHGHVFFEDQTIRYVDSTDNSRSSGDLVLDMSKSRTLSGFDWKSGDGPTLEPAPEEPNYLGDSATGMLVSIRDQTGRESVLLGNDIVVEEVKRLGAMRVEPASSTDTDDSDRPQKRRDFREMVCSGISGLIQGFFVLIKGKQQDNDCDDVEYGPIRHVPRSLSTLASTTNFTKEELKTMYRTFKNECPSGIIYEDNFKSIYSQFFPSGDTNLYAHYLFIAFDDKHEGFICFEQFITALSCLLRGKLEEKLKWVFHVYDVNGDGFIKKEILEDIVKSVHMLNGPRGNTDEANHSGAEHANRLFRKLDQNNDGFISFAEFVSACRADQNVVASLETFKAEL